MRADDAVLTATNKDDVKRLLNVFNFTSKNFNMKISTSKSKIMS